MLDGYPGKKINFAYSFILEHSNIFIYKKLIFFSQEGTPVKVVPFSPLSGRFSYLCRSFNNVRYHFIPSSCFISVFSRIYRTADLGKGSRNKSSSTNCQAIKALPPPHPSSLMAIGTSFFLS